MRSLAIAALILSAAPAYATCDFPRSSDEVFACAAMSQQQREDTKPLQQAYDREMDRQHAFDAWAWSNDKGD
jgi:hypothetical protein